MALNLNAAFQFYKDRFSRLFGDVPESESVTFLERRVRRLSQPEFEICLQRYLDVHAACKAMIDTGSTIHDAAIQELREAASWIAIEPPDLLAMFKGEIGDPVAQVTRADVRVPR